MSIRALLAAAATGALAFGAGSALAGQSDSLRAIDRSEALQGHHMTRAEMLTELDRMARSPDYYAVNTSSTEFQSPEYYATVATPHEFYASIAPIPQDTASQFASIDEILATTSSVADASVTLDNYPQALEASGALEATPADASFTTSAPTLEIMSSMPVPDTPENRARFGGPLSRAGRMTAPAGN